MQIARHTYTFPLSTLLCHLGLSSHNHHQRASAQERYNTSTTMPKTQPLTRATHGRHSPPGVPPHRTTALPSQQRPVLLLAPCTDHTDQIPAQAQEMNHNRLYLCNYSLRLNAPVRWGAWHVHASLPCMWHVSCSLRNPSCFAANPAGRWGTGVGPGRQDSPDGPFPKAARLPVTTQLLAP